MEDLDVSKRSIGTRGYFLEVVDIDVMNLDPLDTFPHSA